MNYYNQNSFKSNFCRGLAEFFKYFSVKYTYVHLATIGYIHICAFSMWEAKYTYVHIALPKLIINRYINNKLSNFFIRNNFLKTTFIWKSKSEIENEMKFWVSFSDTFKWNFFFLLESSNWQNHFMICHFRFTSFSIFGYMITNLTEFLKCRHFK